MPDFTSTLADQPDTFLAVLGNAPFYVEDPSYSPAVKSHFHADATTPMFQIVGRDRICYVNVMSHGGGTRFEARLSGSAQQDALPCYWLPWAKDGAVQIKLRPSRKKAQGGLQAHQRVTTTAKDSSAIVLGRDKASWRDRGIEGTDPVLFFTGMMNGCSVWVAGDPTEPLVYHINRASFGGEKVLELLEKSADKDINRLKSDQMEKDFKTFHAPDQKTKAFGRVTPATQQLRNPMPGAPAADKVRLERTKVLRSITGPKGEEYYIQKHLVTAFGVRTGGRWSFYKQDIYEYFLYTPAGQVDRFSGNARVAASRAERFFPA